MDEILQNVSDIVNTCLGPLGTNDVPTFDFIRDFLIQIAATLILFLVVRFFLWNKITDIIEKRQEAMDQAYLEAKEAREHAISLEKELQDQMAQAQAQVKELLDKAEKDANARRDQIINEAKDEAKRRLDNVKLEIEQETQKKNKEIKQEIIDIAFETASKIVAKEVDKEKYLYIVDDILKGAK